MTKPNLAIVSPIAGEETETFIKQHIKGLAIDFHFSGGDLPIELLYQNKKITLGLGLSYQAFWSILKQVFRNKSISGPFIRNERFKSALRAYKIKILLLEYGPTAAACLPACRDLGIPMIVFFHGFDVFSYEIIEKHKENYSKVAEYASSLFVVSESMKNKLVEIGLPPSKLTLNPCCPHPRFFSIKPDYSKRNIISVGRFVNKKAPYYNLYAFKLLLEKYPNAKFIFCGDGALFESCINLAKIWNIQHSVKFIGKVSSDTIFELMGNACMYIQHSVEALNGDSEGTPVAILEAMAAGLAIISTNHSGIAQAVKDGVSGFLVEEHEVEKMAKKMIYLFDHPELLKKMGENGRAIVKKKYDSTQHLNLIRRAVNDAL